MAYKIYGTNESYTGMVVGPIGGYMYTTRGGTLEGDSKQVYQEKSTQTGPEQNVTTMAERAANNPVVRTFVSRVIYYRQDGTAVQPGANLHQHADGTIMMGHDANNMGAIVTRNRPRGAVIRTIGTAGGVGTGTDVPAPGEGMTPPGGGTGGGNTGGGTGGGMGGGGY